MEDAKAAHIVGIRASSGTTRRRIQTEGLTIIHGGKKA